MLRVVVLVVAAILPLQIAPAATDAAAMPTITAIAAGGSHTCALTSEGGVKCWGSNDRGQLGNGRTTDSLTPVEVSGLTSGVIAIAEGGAHTCALTSGGAVKCWGADLYGQLGNGFATPTDFLTPVDVSGLTSGVTAITAGDNHTCALTSEGAVKCWGAGDLGRLGNGDTNDVKYPSDVTGLATGITAVAAGGGHTCALTSGGGVKCWGGNRSGQLGNGRTTDTSIPVDVTGLATGITAIAAGSAHTCAQTSGGGVKCWGANGYGQLGNGTGTGEGMKDSLTAVNVLSGVTAITAGDDHTCALTSEGGVKCWGANAAGQLGYGKPTDFGIDYPIDVYDLPSGVTAIAAGRTHTCGLASGGGVWCWGGNDAGQLGNGLVYDSLAPANVDFAGQGPPLDDGPAPASSPPGDVDFPSPEPPLTPVATATTPTITAIAAGRGHTCALTSGGGVICWGYTESQLSNDASYALPVPVDLSGLTSGVTAIAAGFNHTCALTSGGGVKCWGANDGGELGNGTTTTSIVAVDVHGLTSSVSAIAAGSWHTCALTSRGRVKCWGLNDIGQLGRSESDRLTPVDVSGLASGITAIASGNGHTCVVTNGGRVKCWGSNSSGQLGNGSTTDSLVPVDVSGLESGVIAVAAGDGHTCALTSGGGVKCWGDDLAGQLGNGSTIDSSIPVDVSGLASGVTAIAAGYDHTCALTSGGGVKCWGWNGSGQLGNDSTTHSSSPVDVSGLTSGITAIAAGDGYTCALSSGGGVKCWGANPTGPNGSTIDSLTPVDVDLASQGPPGTDAADPGSHEKPADLPLLPLLAGLAGGIALLARRRVMPAPLPDDVIRTDPGS